MTPAASRIRRLGFPIALTGYDSSGILTAIEERVEVDTEIWLLHMIWHGFMLFASIGSTSDSLTLARSQINRFRTRDRPLETLFFLTRLRISVAVHSHGEDLS